MKQSNEIKSIFFGLLVCFAVTSTSAMVPMDGLSYYPTTNEQELCDTIVAVDQIYFEAYDNCSIENYEDCQPH